MPVLEPVVATLIANIEPFVTALDEAQAKADEFQAKLNGLGTVSGGGAAAGATAAEDLAGASGGVTIGEQAEKSAKGVRNLGKASKDTGGLIGSLVGNLGSLGGPAADIGSKTDQLAGRFEHATANSNGLLGRLQAIPKSYLLTGAAVAATGYIAVKMGMQYQSATDQIAASGDMSIKQATAITNAFQTTAFQTTVGVQQIAEAYGQYVGQINAVNGGTANASQALDFMKNSIDLSEASGQSLTTTTKALTSTMQAFHMPLKNAGQATDILWNASHKTGVNLTQLGTQLGRVHSTLGAVAPPLADMGGLLVDMTQHGIVGRQATAALNQTFTAFLKPLEGVSKAQRTLLVTQQALPPSLQNLANEYKKGTMNAKDATAATKGLDVQQTTLWGKYKSAADAMFTINQQQHMLGIQALTSTGQLKPLPIIIQQLHDQLKNLSPVEAVAQLKAEGFGGAAAKIYGVIQSGGPALQQYIDQVSKAGSAHSAADKATAGLKAQLEKLKSGFGDVLTKLGINLLPKVTDVAKWLLGVVDYLKKHPLVSEIAGAGVISIFALKLASKVSSALSNVFSTGSSIFKGLSGWYQKIKGLFGGGSGGGGGGVKLPSQTVGTMEVTADVVNVNGGVGGGGGLAGEATTAGEVSVGAVGADVVAGAAGGVLGALAAPLVLAAGGVALGLYLRTLKDTPQAIAAMKKGVVPIGTGGRSGSGAFFSEQYLRELQQHKTSTSPKSSGFLGEMAGKTKDQTVQYLKHIADNTSEHSKHLRDQVNHLQTIVTSNAAASYQLREHSLHLAKIADNTDPIKNPVKITIPPATIKNDTNLTSTVVLQLDGRQIATAVTKYQLQNARSTGNSLGRYAGGSQTATSTGTSTYAIPRG